MQSVLRTPYSGDNEQTNGLCLAWLSHETCRVRTPEYTPSTWRYDRNKAIVFSLSLHIRPRKTV